MKAYAVEKAAEQLPTPEAEKKKEEELTTQEGKKGDDKTQRAIDRAGPAVVKEVQEGEKEKKDGAAPNPEAQDKQAEEKKKEEDPTIEYGEDVSVPSRLGMKLAVLMHPAFHHQGKNIAKNGGNDAFILFYWVILDHLKIPNISKVRDFRNKVTQEAKPGRVKQAAEWIAQADKSEYTVNDLLEFLTGRRDTVKSKWEKTPMGRGADAEMEEANDGDYKDWGRVDQQGMGYFPLVDFVRGNEAVSLKTVDPKDPETIERLKAHIQELAARKPMKDKEELKLIVDLRVPPGSDKKLDELVAFGAELNVEVKISEKA